MLALLLMQAQQGRQGAQAQGQGPSQLDQAIQYLKKGKQTYDDGKKLYDLGTSAYNYFAGPSYTQATQAAWNQAAGQASQQAWNASADAASGIGSEAANAAPGTNYAGWAAAAMSAYNSANQILDKNARDEQKTYDATLAVPRAVAAYYTAGLSTLGEGFARKQWGGTMKKVDKLMSNPVINPIMGASKLWTSDKWKTEGKRLKGLQDKGVVIPEFLQGAMTQSRGRKTKDLINPYLPQDFVGATPQYGWVNNKFATSRDSKDLTARDIWGYSAFFDKYGNDWLGKFSEKQREDIANRALQRGAVKEHHGTIDINWTPELDTEIGTITGGNKIPKAQPGKPQPTQPQPQPQAPAPVAALNANRKGILGRIR
jgi:hypothetical protein